MYVDIPDNDRLFWSCDEAESQLLISSQINDARLWNVFGIDREPLSRIFIGCRFIQMAAIKTGKSFRKSWQYSWHAILFKWQQWNTKRANKKQIIEGTNQACRFVLLLCFGQYMYVRNWNKNIFLSLQKKIHSWMNSYKDHSIAKVCIWSKWILKGRHYATSLCKPWHR